MKKKKKKEQASRFDLAWWWGRGRAANVVVLHRLCPFDDLDLHRLSLSLSLSHVWNVLEEKKKIKEGGRDRTLDSGHVEEKNM